MSLLDPYVTAEEYNARSNRSRTAGDADTTTLEEELTAMTRLLEQECGISLGGWHSIHGTRVFDGHGTNILRLRDREGLAYFLQDIDSDGLKIDSDMDGSYDDYMLDFADAWVRGLPENAAVLGTAFTAIELRPLSTATITVFPALAGCVEITGPWGLPAAQLNVIKEVIISMTRDLRDHHAGGSAAQFQRVDESMPLSDQTWRLIASMKRQWSRRLPAVA